MGAPLETAKTERYGREEFKERVARSNSAERALLQRLQGGNRIAFREFVERYQSDVYRIAHGITGNNDCADEVAQQIFAKAYFSVDRFDGRSSLYVWLYRMAVNECCTFVRKQSSNHFNADSSAGKQLVPDATRTQRKPVNHLFERIPERNRYLLLLRELEGCSVAHLADATGLNENTIRAKLLRTRRALARAMSFSL
jgi:RNA polymerase sigma-70 factor (ECF subfamily)